MINAKDGGFFVSDWLRNRNTVDFLGSWESIHNPNFNYGEFAIIRTEAGLNRFKISAKEWITRTNALDYPKYIRLLVNQEKRMFSIQVSSEDEKDSSKLSNSVLDNRNGFEISVKQLIHLIFEFMNWDTNVSYKVYGIKDVTQNARFFTLEEATKIIGYSNE